MLNRQLKRIFETLFGYQGLILTFSNHNVAQVPHCFSHIRFMASRFCQG